MAPDAVVRAPADGYTLLLGGAVNAVNATLYENLGFNFISDLTPVGGVSRFPNVMTVNASFPARTVPEFIAYARANPGKVNQGSSGNGTTQHLAGALFKMMTGADFLHVPYKGAPQLITDLFKMMTGADFLHVPYKGAPQVITDLFKMMTGADFLHVPYKGAPQAITDLLNG